MPIALPRFPNPLEQGRRTLSGMWEWLARLWPIWSRTRRRQLKTLEAKLGAILLVALLLPTLIVGWWANNLTVRTIRDEKIKEVGRVADIRHNELVLVLAKANARGAAFVADMSGRCSLLAAPAATSCATSALRSFVSSEQALGAVLRRRGIADDIVIGRPSVANGEVEPFQPRQIARFSKPEPSGERTYYIDVVAPQAELMVIFPAAMIQTLFATTATLGQSGETFLSDERGFFITKPRYSSVHGHSHPISAGPMRDCLSTGDGEALDPDYRGVAVIHGFRFVPEIGGGCIMAHFDQAEAFAPLTTLRWRFAAASLLFIALAVAVARRVAQRIVRPIVDLNTVTDSIMNGDYDACAVVSGHDEMAGLSRNFNRMIERLTMTVGELREQKTLLEHRVRQRTSELEAANEKLGALSRSDGLTGVANRRHLDEVLDVEWRRAARLGTPLAMIFLDVDHFKRFNDHYGHLAGDDCLRSVGAVLNCSVQRAGELAARYGGEEFALILHDTEAEQAASVAEAIRLAVGDLAIPHALSDAGFVTVSLGVAVVVPDGTEEVSALVALADKALYRAKAEGRNRVVVADADVTVPLPDVM